HAHVISSAGSFFPTAPPPPTPTLFPYTTLFRSYYECDGTWPPGRRSPSPPKPRSRGSARMQASHRRHLPSRRLLCAGRDGGGSLDRKSTRLNSSHDQISYAVFCLKKKKHTTPVK